MTSADVLHEELAAFEAAAIAPDAFDHEAHVRVAWTMLGTADLDECLRRYPLALKRITRRLGVPEKFHATVTGFLLLLIAERRAAMPTAGWADFRSANRDLVTEARQLLGRHYTRERLGAELARSQFLLPDRNGVSAA